MKAGLPLVLVLFGASPSSPGTRRNAPLTASGSPCSPSTSLLRDPDQEIAGRSSRDQVPRARSPTATAEAADHPNKSCSTVALAARHQTRWRTSIGDWTIVALWRHHSAAQRRLRRFAGICDGRRFDGHRHDAKADGRLWDVSVKPRGDAVPAFGGGMSCEGSHTRDPRRTTDRRPRRQYRQGELRQAS